jgi:hypothetical protein
MCRGYATVDNRTNKRHLTIFTDTEGGDDRRPLIKMMVAGPVIDFYSLLSLHMGRVWEGRDGTGWGGRAGRGVVGCGGVRWCRVGWGVVGEGRGWVGDGWVGGWVGGARSGVDWTMGVCAVCVVYQ